MRKIIISVLCVSLLLVGCSTQIDNMEGGDNNTTNDTDVTTVNDIPKGFSEEFYNDMLVANELIEKSIVTKYIYLEEEFEIKLMNYYYIIHKDDLTDANKRDIKNFDMDIDKTLSYKEEYTFNILWEIMLNLSLYHVNPDSERIRQEIDDQYRQFKILLEIKEP